MVDRLRPAKDLLRMVQLLSAHKAFGLTVAELADHMEFSRRTTQRYLAALRDLEPDLNFFVGEDEQSRRWYLPTTKARIPPVTAEQLSSLTAIAAFMDAQGHRDYAATLSNLRDILQAGLDRAALVRIDPDLEGLDSSVEVTHRPGPKASYDPAVRSAIFEAILMDRQLEFEYTDVRGRKRSTKRVSPYAIIVGPRVYLIARDHQVNAVRNYALTGMNGLTLLDISAERGDFDARAYVEKSFGAFHDGIVRRWVLHFKPETAHELSLYQFHPSQTMRTLPSGEIEVAFESESIREVAYECFRWSEHLTWVEPLELREMIHEICASVKAVCQY